MNNQKLVSYFQAAWLSAPGNDHAVKIKADGKHAHYFVDDNPMVNEDLESFKNSEELQMLVRGIAAHRRAVKRYWKERRKREREEFQNQDDDVDDVVAENDCV